MNPKLASSSRWQDPKNARRFRRPVCALIDNVWPAPPPAKGRPASAEPPPANLNLPSANARLRTLSTERAPHDERVRYEIDKKSQPASARIGNRIGRLNLKI